jgi:predicted permease
MTGFWQDVRQALRVLERSPRFAAVALATLALGIGVNTAVFSVVNAVLLKPLPFDEPERLMLVHLVRPDLAGVPREVAWSYPKYRSFMEDQAAFGGGALFAGREFDLAGDGDPLRVRGEVVTERYPGVLGVNPILGRSFTFEEANREGSAVAMLGHGLWASRYGADPAIVGRTIEINALRYTVVGVLPPGFTGLSGNAQLWAPLAAVAPTDLIEPYSHSYFFVARRAPSVSAEAAAANVRLNGERIAAEFASAEDPPGPIPDGASAASLDASRADLDVRRASLIVLGAVGFVLLIACANLTHLFLARGVERRREIAIRSALGASGGRIARHLFVESMLLAGAGGLVGLLLASVLLDAAAAILPDPDVFFRSAVAPGTRRIAGAAGLTRIGADAIGLDMPTLLFTFAITVVTAGLVALVPALRASSSSPIDALKAAGTAAGSLGRRDFALRAAPIVMQLTLSLVLLTGAGLMVRSGMALHGTALGIDPANLLTVRVDLPAASYTPERGAAFHRELLERVGALPGIDAAAWGSCAPVSGGCNGTRLRFLNPEREGFGAIGVHWVSPDYFSTLGMTLVEGRNFAASDAVGRPKVVLVDAATARALWPNESPIGKIVAVDQGGFQDGAEVIGVVSSTRYRAIETAATSDVYLPVTQSYQRRMLLFVRSTQPIQSVVAAIEPEVRALDPNLPLAEIKTMETRVDDAMWRTRVGTWLLGAFAALALLLTAIGIYGVMAETVARRTTEISIRMALGAQARDVLNLVMRRATLVTGLGITVGVLAALGLTRLIGAMLYDVRPHDPITFVAVALLLGLVALLACYLPARRASRLDAVVGLRSE